MSDLHIFRFGDPVAKPHAAKTEIVANAREHIEPQIVRKIRTSGRWLDQNYFRRLVCRNRNSVFDRMLACDGIAVEQFDVVAARLKKSYAAGCDGILNGKRIMFIGGMLS